VPATLPNLFDHQPRIFAHGQMLADRVLVEEQERGEPDGILRAPGVFGMTEDLMARWATESPGFPLGSVGAGPARPLVSSSRCVSHILITVTREGNRAMRAG
jgi:hypothetical protein